MTAFSLNTCPICKTKLSQQDVSSDIYGEIKIYECKNVMMPWGEKELPHYSISFVTYEDLRQNIILPNNLFVQNHCKNNLSKVYDKNGRLLLSLPRLLINLEEMIRKIQILLPFL